MANNQTPFIVDGSLDFSGGVDSIRTTTIQSNRNPNGLRRDQLAWLNNGTVRGGGITQRTGWTDLGQIAPNGLYQGGWMYDPDGEHPYLILSVNGNILRVNIDGFGVSNLSAAFGLINAVDQLQSFFCQAEEFLVIQSGDNVTLPLFWDGATLRRSLGITNPAVAPGTPGVNEIPAATAMDYYMGRLWYAQGRQYSAGDIVRGNSGTVAYAFRDAVLNVTENPLVLGGDGFTVPSNAGNIRGIAHSANLDSALGEGQLFIFTRKAIYSLSVPVTRANWIAATNDNQPIQKVVQRANGSVNDRGIVAINGDLFFQSLEPSIRSLVTAVRYFEQWGNTPISIEETRILQFNDRSLLRYCSGIEFSNRLLMTALPRMTVNGVAHQALVPLNFDVISTLGEKKPPVWEGMYEGLDIMQVFTGDFGGRVRAFAVAASRVDRSLHLWELTDALRFENGDNRVTWQIEFPAFTWGDEFTLKKLVSADLWVDKLYGEVVFNMEYRPDGDPCWHPWHQWKQCVARNCEEDVNNPVCYPVEPFRESFRQPMSLPIPPDACNPISKRPMNVAYQIQPRLTIIGWCRVRGLMLKAEWVQESLYNALIC